MTSFRNWCTAARPADAPQLSVLYADPGVLVLEKPAGLLSVPGRGPDKQDCLSRRVQDRFPDALVVHRLDMATSGLMLMARGPLAQTAMGKAFASRQVHKRYQAMAHGLMPAHDGRWQEIDLPIALDWLNRPRRVVCAATGKPSLTRWRVLAHAPDGCTQLELEPVTGRSHQLRVHLLAIGHPIVGDMLYTAPAPVADRLMLHATQICFDHPLTGAPMAFENASPFGVSTACAATALKPPTAK